MTSSVNQTGSPRASKLILLSVCIGQTIVGMDQRAITVALPTLTATFHTAFTTIQWTILIYDLVLIGLIMARRSFRPAPLLQPGLLDLRDRLCRLRSFSDHRPIDLF